MINVLKYTERLEKAGFTENQAKENVNLWMDFMDNNFVSKNDLSEFALTTQMSFGFTQLKAEFKEESAKQRAELKEEISELRLELRGISSSLTIKLGLMMATSIGILSSIMFSK
jgi:hypothetical protein